MDRKKRVVIFIPEFPSRSETFIVREVSKLIELGHLDIVVVALKRGDNILPAVTERVVVYRRLDVRALLGLPFFCVLHIGSVIQAFKLVESNPNRTLSQTLYLFSKSLGYALIFSKYRPDIIYSHFLSEPSTIALVASKVLAVELALAGHAKDVVQEAGPIKSENAELLKTKVENSRFVTVCNKYAWQKLTGLAKDFESRVFLKYHGVDYHGLVNWEVAELKKPSRPLIFTNGRFTEKKGHIYLIQASKILKERGVAHEVYIFGGPGDYYERTVAEIKSLGLEDHITIIGGGRGLPFDKVIPYYKIADVFAFPGVTTKTGDADGIATVLIEAALFKIPVVATDAGSTTDFIRHNETGVLVPQKDAYALAGALEKLLFDRAYGARLAENAFTKAREMFDLDKNVRELDKLFS